MTFNKKIAVKLIIVLAVEIILGVFIFFQREKLNESPFSSEFSFQFPFLAGSDSENNLYLLDNGVKRLTKIKPSGEVVFSLNGGKRGEGEFYQAWKMAIDKNDRVYIFNGVRNIKDGLTDIEQIIRYNPNGSFDKIVWEDQYNDEKRQELYDIIGGESVLALTVKDDFVYFFRAEWDKIKDQTVEKITLYKINTESKDKKPELVLSLPIGGGDIVDITGTNENDIYFTKRDGKIYTLDKGQFKSIEIFQNDPKRITKPWNLSVSQDGTVYFMDLFEQAIVTISPDKSVVKDFFSKTRQVQKNPEFKTMILRTITLNPKGAITTINETNKNLIYIQPDGEIGVTLDKGNYSTKAMILRWFVWIEVLIFAVFFLFFFKIVYVNIFNRKISLIIKQLTFLMPIIFAGIYYTANMIYEQVYTKYEEQLSRTLAAMAQVGAPRISGDTLEKITKPGDFMNNDYQKIKKEIFDNLNNRKDSWNENLYTIIYKIIDGTFYIAANTSGYYGVLFPWANIQAIHTASYEKGETGFIQYTDSEGRWLIGTSPIKNSQGKIVGVYELGTDMYVAKEVRDLFVKELTRGLIISIAIFTLIFIILAYMLLVYIRILRNSVEKVTSGQWGITIDIKSRDEIGDLGKGFNVMSQQIKNYILEITALSEAYYRFVPQEFLKFLERQSIVDVRLGDQIQREMTVLFCDIRSFTSISEKLTPEENFNFINEYMGKMGPVIRQHEGFIDKYIGDAIMALFPENPDNAVTSAVEMLQALNRYNVERMDRGQDMINIGIGLHFGKLMLGIVGEQERREGTVISDAVNLSSRLEGLTKMYGAGIIISEHTRANLKKSYRTRLLDKVKVKGKAEPVEIFEVVDGLLEDIAGKKIETRDEFETALKFYFQGEFDQALKAFEQLEKKNPKDKAIHLYIERCGYFVKNGAPDDWDGVIALDHK